MINSKTGIIGVGNMAGALLSGVLSGGIESPGSLVLYDICPEKLTRFTDMGCRTASSEVELVQQCDTIILAIKPQGFPELLAKIKDVLDESKLVISIAAGQSVVAFSAIKFIIACVAKN